jgi:hypothetical protein
VEVLKINPSKYIIRGGVIDGISDYTS